jgi:streptogramin lyase
MKHQHLLAFGLLALSSTVLAGCGGGGSPSFGGSTSTNTGGNTNQNPGGNTGVTSYAYDRIFTTDSGDPQNLAINPSTGNLYAADYRGGYSEYSSSGTLIGNFGTSGPGAVTAGVGCAIDSSGNVYIGDGATDVVDEFTSTGAYIKTFTATALNDVDGVAVDSSGNVYVANYSSSSVVVFNSSGVQTWQINTGNPEIGIALDPSGDIWVAGRSSKLQHYTPSGQLLGTFGTISSTSALGNISSPYAVTVDPAGNVYLTDGQLTGVNKLNTSGQFVSYIGSGTLQEFNDGVAVDSSGNVYVSSDNNSSNTDEIVEFSPVTTQSFAKSAVAGVKQPK